MTTSDHRGVTTARLLAAVRHEGFNVSETQLKRWRQRGLLPRPQQHHRVGLHGSVTVWPPGTRQHIVALCGLAKRFRRLDDLLLALWWDGWPVDHGELLNQLTRRLLTSPAFVQVDSKVPEEQRLDLIDEMVAKLNLGRLGKPLRPLVARVGKDEADRRSLLTALGLIGAGVAPPVETVDVGRDERSLGDLLAAGLGLSGFATQLTDVGDPTTSAELVDNVVAVADQLPAILAHAQMVIRGGDLNELCCARDQARSLEQMACLAQTGILPSHDGLGHMALYMACDDPDGWVVTLTTVLWLRKTASEELQALIAVIEETAPVAAVLAGIPELADLNRQAAGDPDRLAELVQAHPKIGDTITAFLADHLPQGRDS